MTPPKKITASGVPAGMKPLVVMDLADAQQMAEMKRLLAAKGLPHHVAQLGRELILHTPRNPETPSTTCQ